LLLKVGVSKNLAVLQPGVRVENQLVDQGEFRAWLSKDAVLKYDRGLVQESKVEGGRSCAAAVKIVGKCFGIRNLTGGDLPSR
jgi:hypothetical protein